MLQLGGKERNARELGTIECRFSETWNLMPCSAGCVELPRITRVETAFKLLLQYTALVSVTR